MRLWPTLHSNDMTTSHLLASKRKSVARQAHGYACPADAHSTIVRRLILDATRGFKVQEVWVTRGLSHKRFEPQEVRGAGAIEVADHRQQAWSAGAIEVVDHRQQVWGAGAIEVVDHRQKEKCMQIALLRMLWGKARTISNQWKANERPRTCLGHAQNLPELIRIVFSICNTVVM